MSNRSNEGESKFRIVFLFGKLKQVKKSLHILLVLKGKKYNDIFSYSA